MPFLTRAMTNIKLELTKTKTPEMSMYLINASQPLYNTMIIAGIKNKIV